MSTPNAPTVEIPRAEHARVSPSPQNGRNGNGVSARLGLRGGLDLEAMARLEETKLVQRLFLGPDCKVPRAVLFAGVEREGGCARICARAAQTVAPLTRGHVCVVDANLRSPSVHRWVGMENRDGLVDAIGNLVPAPTLAKRMSPENLWLLTSGPAVQDPELLLTPDRVRPHMQRLRAQFDHILISSPPLNECSESLALGRLVDGVVLIVEANSTRRQAVRRAIGRLEAFDIPLLGIVLNGRTYPIPEPLYRLL